MPSFPGIDNKHVASGAMLLLDQVPNNTFEYLVVQKRYRIFEELQSIEPNCTVQSGKQHAVLRMCAEVKTILAQGLRAY